MTAQEALAAAIVDASESWLLADLNGVCSPAAAAHVLAALSAAGWAVVPKVPTEAMKRAGRLLSMSFDNESAAMSDEVRAEIIADLWSDMLAASSQADDIPASGPQTASLREKPEFGR